MRTIVIPLNRRGQIDDCLEATGVDLLVALHTAVHTAASPDAKEDEIVRGDIAPLCVAHYAKDLSTRLVVDRKWPRGVRPYTVREYARLQGVPDSFEFSGTSRDAYRMIGNGVPIPIGRWIAENILRYFAAGVPLVDRSPLLTLTSN